MKVLIGCEESGIFRSQFRLFGHEAWSCDLVPSDDDSEYHYQCDIFEAIKMQEWDLIILHPPCDHLAVCGNRWYGNGTPGSKKRTQAMVWTTRLWNAAVSVCPRVALENPVSVIFTVLREKGVPVQVVQPHWFGHKEMKATCFALHGLPELVPTDKLDVPDKETQDYLDWQKVWRMPPGPDRKKMRSRSYPGMAAAIAAQWGTWDESPQTISQMALV
jgi:hypothetical protein